MAAQVAVAQLLQERVDLTFASKPCFGFRVIVSIVPEVPGSNLSVAANRISEAFKSFMDPAAGYVQSLKTAGYVSFAIDGVGGFKLVPSSSGVSVISSPPVSSV